MNYKSYGKRGRAAFAAVLTTMLLTDRHALVLLKQCPNSKHCKQRGKRSPEYFFIPVTDFFIVCHLSQFDLKSLYSAKSGTVQIFI